MSLTVQVMRPVTLWGRGLLSQSHAYLASLYPPEHNHYLGAEALDQPHVTFWVASERAKPLGCIALARKDGYGEVKSMFVTPEARGKGVGDALLTALETRAGEDGLPLLRLETGDTLDAAHRLYRRHGFTETGPFGDYEEGPHSVFMEKRL